jgi:protein TonB
MKTMAKMGYGMKDGAPGMKWPLLGSAAVHLLLLSLFLLAGASVDTHIAQVVPVILVEGAGLTTPGAGESVAGFPDGAQREASSRGEATVAPMPPPSSTAPPAPIGSSSAHDRISPGSSTPGPADESATPLPSKAWPLSSIVAPLSGEPDVVASSRNGRAASLPASRSGAILPGSREATAENGGAPPGAGTAGMAGGPATGHLRKKIQSAIVYPEEAIRRGQEGEVLLRIRIGDGGVPKEIRVARSSGTRALDEAARRGVESASPLPSYTGWVEIPVRFFLR